MSGEDEGISFKLDGDASGFQAAISDINNGLDELGHAAHTLEGAFAFDGIKEAFTEVLSVTATSDANMRKFAGTMAATGAAADPARLDEFAAGIAKVTTFSQDDVVAGAAQLARFRLTQDQIEQLLPSVADLAAYMGRDLAGAADDVGRAIAQGSRGLMSLNLGFTATQRKAFDAADSQQRLDMIMQKMSTTVKGTAAIMADSAVGAHKQLSNAVDELYISFGKVIDAPIAASFRSVTGVVQSLKDTFDGLGSNTKNTLASIATGLGILGAAAAGIVAVSGALGIIGGLLPALAAGFTLMASAFTTILLPIAAVAAGVVGMIALVGALQQAWDADLFGMQSAFTDTFGGIQTFWRDLLAWMKDLWDSFTAGLSEKLITLYGMVKGMSPDETHAMVAESNKQSGGVLGNAVPNLKGAFTYAKDTLSQGAGYIKDSFTRGADVLKDALKGMGIDLGKLFGGGPSASGLPAAHGGRVGNDMSGGDSGPAYSLTDLMGGKPIHLDADSINKQLGAAMVQAFDGAPKAASEFLHNLSQMSQLSDATLQAIIGNVGAFPDKIKAAVAGFSGMTDQTVQSLMAATNNNVADAQKLGTVFKNTSQAAMDAMLQATGGSIDASKKMVQAFQGNSDEVVKDTIAFAHNSADDATKMALAFGDLDDKTVKAILDASNHSVAAAVTMSEQMNKLPAVTATAVNNMNAYWQTAAGQLQLALTAITTGLEKFGSSLLAKSGTLGSLVTAGAKGGVSKNADGSTSLDVSGGIASVAAELASKSASFNGLVTKLNGIFQNLANAFNPLFDALGPVVDALTPVIVMVGNVLSQVFKGLQPAFQVLADVLKAIAPILQVVFGTFSNMLGSIFNAINPIIKTLEPIINLIADLLSDIAGPLTTMLSALNPLSIIFDLIGTVMKALQPVLEGVFDVIKMVMEGIEDIFKSFAEAYNGIVSFIADAISKIGGWIPGIGGDIKKFAASLKAGEINMNTFGDAVSNATDSQDAPVPSLAGSADTASTSITDLSSSADQASASIANAATGFSVNAARYNASMVAGTDLSAGQTLPTGAAATPATRLNAALGASLSLFANSTDAHLAAAKAASTTNTINMNVTATDPGKMANQVSNLLAQKNFRMSGTTVPTSGPHAVPKTQGGTT